MGESEIELVRRSFDAWNDHDVEAMREYFAEDVVFHSAMTDVVGRTTQGLDEVASLFKEWDEVWGEYRWDVDRVFEVGDRVVSFHRLVSVGRSSGISMERELAGVYEIRDGRIVEDWIYLDRDEAVRAAGADRAA